MQIEVMLFAGARERVGEDVVRLELGESPSVNTILHRLRADVPELADLLPSCRLAVDGRYVGDSAEVTVDSEVALIPPVSGG